MSITLNFIAFYKIVEHKCDCVFASNTLWFISQIYCILQSNYTKLCYCFKQTVIHYFYHILYALKLESFLQHYAYNFTYKLSRKSHPQFVMFNFISVTLKFIEFSTVIVQKCDCVIFLKFWDSFSRFIAFYKVIMQICNHVVVSNILWFIICIIYYTLRNANIFCSTMLKTLLVSFCVKKSSSHPKFDMFNFMPITLNFIAFYKLIILETKKWQCSDILWFIFKIYSILQSNCKKCVCFIVSNIL